MYLLPILLALAAGALLPVQSGVNATLNNDWARNAALVSFISFGVGTLTAGAYLLASRAAIPPLNGQTQFWQWCGGAMGAFFVGVSVWLVPRLGASAMIALILLGQILSGLLLDQFGLLGYSVRPISWQRLLGLVVMGFGVFLVKKY